MPRTDYTRDELIAICVMAVVPESEWRNRDSEMAQVQLGSAWALLRAGCDFRVIVQEGHIATNHETIWIEVTSKGFNYFEWGGSESMNEETFYLPTPERLDKVRGKDWYL